MNPFNATGEEMENGGMKESEEPHPGSSQGLNLCATLF